jgi:hypothetical protein
MMSQMAWIPEADVGVVVLTNTDGQNLMNALTYRVLDQLLGAPARDWSSVLLTQVKQWEHEEDSTRQAIGARRLVGTKPSRELREYAGTYQHPMFGELAVRQDGDQLTLRWSTESWAKLHHWHLDTFMVEWSYSRNRNRTTTASFRLDPNARVTALDLRGPPFGGDGIVFTRKADPTP